MSSSGTETITPQPYKPLIGRFDNHISESLEEEQKEEAFEDSLEDIDWEMPIRNSVYDL